VRLLAALLRRNRPFATTTSRQREAGCGALSRREAATFSFVVLLFGLNSEPVLCVWLWFVPFKPPRFFAFPKTGVGATERPTGSPIFFF